MGVMGVNDKNCSANVFIIKAKFHYTGPTGHARTFSRDPGRIPGSPTKSADFVWSGPVGPV